MVYINFSVTTRS